MNNQLKIKLENAPNSPGCYFWKNNKNQIIYVGKAKNIKKRLKQYFLSQKNNRINKLVHEINDVDYIIVNNENEALVLENNLIQTHKPKYNVLLKENSNYPYIIVTNEKDPRIIYTRKYSLYKGKAYGPFPSQEINSYEIYNLLQRIIPLRKCKHVPKNKCIYYDLGQCLGPCINKITTQQYDELKKQINDIFKNKIKTVLDNLKKRELESAKDTDFETAQYYLQLQKSLKSLHEKQVVELINHLDVDIIGWYCDNNFIAIIIFNYFDGKLISKNEHISYYYDMEIDEVIISYLVQYYSNNKIPKYIYINLNEQKIRLIADYFNTKVLTANKSKYEKIILMAINNAKKYLQDYRLKSLSEFNRTIGACEELATILNIQNCNRIDMIDNANIFNNEPVSAVVSFINGVKATKYYRKFNLNPIEFKSDYHYMLEALKRRYKKINEDKPDVLIVDGGKAQLNAAKKALEEIGIEGITIIGLIKDSHHKTDSILTSNYQIINLQRNSSLYFLLSNIQEEVHRFAITHFRQRRAKSQMHHFLDDIKGIGEKTKEKLLTIYPNIVDLKDVDEATIAQIVGKKVAKELKDKIMKEFK